MTFNKELDNKEKRSLEEFAKNLTVRKNEIKTAFIKAVGKSMVSPYIITGAYGAPKKIELAVLEEDRENKIKAGNNDVSKREYVRWENKMLTLIPKNNFKKVVGMHDKTIFMK